VAEGEIKVSKLLAEKERERRKKVYEAATEFMAANPKVPFVEVGNKFGISFMTASRLWKAAGFPARKDGRIAGVSPLKKAASNG
jgi:hypothetical protein